MSQHQRLLRGAGLAVAAAGLAACGHTQTTAQPSTAAAEKTDLIHCYGVNVCKGHNDCKTASNACAGHGSCKSQGFVAMPTKSCEDAGGKASREWVGEIARADLIHCYGVNICKGHNDCKTKENACAGHATCKGTGFIEAPAKSCKDIGGTVGK